MKRIDFFGVPGVGKTTLFNFLLQKRENKKVWLSEDEALELASWKNLRGLDHEFSLILKVLKKLPKVSKLTAKYIYKKSTKEPYINFIKNNEAYIYSLYKSIGTNTINNLQKVLYFDNLNRTLKKYSYIDSWINDEMIVWDESLTHKLFAIIPWHQVDYEIITSYCESLPLPNGIVYIYGSPEFVAKNVLKRKRDIKRIEPGHNGLSYNKLTEVIKNTIESSEVGLNILLERGVHILQINSQEDISKNADQITNFINKIN